jgi:hypothetical protein
VRLVGFGCSCTDGYALDNKTDAWPYVLSTLLNTNCCNEGFAGASNKYILNKICNFEFELNDIVVVLWSHTDRTCVLRENTTDHLGVWKTDDQSKAWMKYILDENDMFIDMYQRIQHASFYLDNKKIKNFHVLHDPKDSKREYKWFDKTLLKTSMAVLRHQYPKAPGDNKHPGILAHKEFANGVFEEIKELL